MADQVMVTKAKLDSLAEVVSAKSGEPLTLTIDGMVDAVLDMELGITPSGTKRIAANGMHDVTEYADAYVAVQPELESLTVDPSTHAQQFVPGYGYDGFSDVYVNAVKQREIIFTPSLDTQYAVPTASGTKAVLHRGFSLDFLSNSSQSSVSTSSQFASLVDTNTYALLGSFDLVFNNIVQQRLFVNTTWTCYTSSKQIVFTVETEVEDPLVRVLSMSLSKSILSGTISRTASCVGLVKLVSNGFQVMNRSFDIGFSKVTVEPIPSNYGLITWNGSVLTVS